MGIRFDWMQFWKSHPFGGGVDRAQKKKKKGVPCDNATTIDHDRFRNKAMLIFLGALSAFLTKQIWWRIRGSLPSVGWMIHGYSTVLMNEIK